MKFKFAAAAFLAAATFATPCMAADFTGPRIGATIGLADDDFAGAEVFTYGVNAGYDFDLGKAVVGGTIEYQDSSEDGFGRNLAATVRAGVKATDNVLVYGLVGYTNQGVEDSDIELDGIRAGAGVEVALGKGAFGQVEYRYSNFEADVEGHQFVLGIGYRF
jgi:outer membrane immunogenic protein